MKTEEVDSRSLQDTETVPVPGLPLILGLIGFAAVRLRERG